MVRNPRALSHPRCRRHPAPSLPAAEAAEAANNLYQKKNGIKAKAGGRGGRAAGSGAGRPLSGGRGAAQAAARAARPSANGEASDPDSNLLMHNASAGAQQPGDWREPGAASGGPAEQPARTPPAAAAQPSPLDTPEPMDHDGDSNDSDDSRPLVRRGPSNPGAGADPGAAAASGPPGAAGAGGAAERGQANAGAATKRLADPAGSAPPGGKKRRVAQPGQEAPQALQPKQQPKVKLLPLDRQAPMLPRARSALSPLQKLGSGKLEEGWEEDHAAAPPAEGAKKAAGAKREKKAAPTSGWPAAQMLHTCCRDRSTCCCRTPPGTTSALGRAPGRQGRVSGQTTLWSAPRACSGQGLGQAHAREGEGLQGQGHRCAQHPARQPGDRRGQSAAAALVVAAHSRDLLS
jgi:hypothetical protein